MKIAENNVKFNICLTTDVLICYSKKDRALLYTVRCSALGALLGPPFGRAGSEAGLASPFGRGGRAQRGQRG